MPITAPAIAPVSEEEMRALDYQVMAHVFAAHRELGRLCDERIYQSDLAMRLASSGISAVCEVPVTLAFRGFATTRLLDLVVEEQAVYELKGVAQLTAAHEAQLLNYLLLTGGSRGKLVNFRPTSVETRFVNTSLDFAARHAFDIDLSTWRGPADLGNACKELVADWGTALETSLYHEALVHVCGGADSVTTQLLLRRGQSELGRQRFSLCAPREAFGVTCFESDSLSGFELHLRRLISHSPLRAYHWINIARHRLKLVSLDNPNSTN